jgi:hypothetical protein
MEGAPSSQALLAEAERAAAAPYVDYPPSPRWFAPAAGLWAAGLVLAATALGDHPAVAIPIAVVPRRGRVPALAAEMAILDNSTSTDFTFLRRYLDVSDSDLSSRCRCWRMPAT